MDKYQPSEFEEEIYKFWLDNKFFASKVNKNKEKFSLTMPPPNVTGQAHVGHALNNTIQDIIARRKRMQGFETCWVPGTDHAAIATEAKVVEKLKIEGKTKDEVGRDEFLKLGWEWYKKYGNTIVGQLQKLGISCDWDRLAFTMDDNLNRAVKEAFVEYYNKGLIYKGTKVVNWCPNCKSAISDIENVYVEQNTNLWHIKYPLEDGSGFIIVATTRPETMFGDTAVAVNPNDKRYKEMVGKNVILPIVNRKIPVVADEYSEMEFGTGAVKITPAHDPNDYELGLRHNLPIISCIDDGGILNDEAGKFAGMDRVKARPLIEEELRKLGVLVKVEKYKNKVGTCDRCKTLTEPKISTQWFVKMKKLVKPAIEVVKNGTLKFTPKRYAKQYLNWLENIQDWCISRQIWLGHRIPVYYCDSCSKQFASVEDVKCCPKCGKKVRQDEDVLDTWFSSALWPFSVFGWPEKTDDLQYFYPTNVLVTAYDIIAFWVTKMVYSGMEFMKECPFTDCVINGIVRDAQGRKMSKSLGNGIDPLEVIKEYGSDSLRLSLISGMAMGTDTKYSTDKAKDSKIFINKLWNASKFVLTNTQDLEKAELNFEQLLIEDKWILNEFNKLCKEVNKNLDKYEQGIAIGKIIDFIWNKYCDWYIELTKTRLYGEDEKGKQTAKNILLYVLEGILKIIHPFIPFVTEKIYQNVPNHNKTVMLEEYPKYENQLNFKEAKSFERIMEVIKAVRNARAELNVPDNKRTSLFIKAIKDKGLIEAEKNNIVKLAFGTELNLIDNKLDGKYTKVVTEICEVYIPTSELVDENKEKERINKEIDLLKSEITRSEKMLNNAGFVNKAPKSLIDNEKDKLARNKQKLQSIMENL